MIQGRLSVPARAQYTSQKRKSQVKRAIEARWRSKREATNDEASSKQQIGLQGSRIVDMGNLASSVKEVTRHSAECGGQCIVDGEVMHAGLAAVLKISCDRCGKSFVYKHLRKVSTADGKGGRSTLQQFRADSNRWWHICIKHHSFHHGCT